MRPSPKLIDFGIDFIVRLKFYKRAHKIALLGSMKISFNNKS